jgi:hypothetical protein
MEARDAAEAALKANKEYQSNLMQHLTSLKEEMDGVDKLLVRDCIRYTPNGSLNDGFLYFCRPIPKDWRKMKTICLKSRKILNELCLSLEVRRFNHCCR